MGEPFPPLPPGVGAVTGVRWVTAGGGRGDSSVPVPCSPARSIPGSHVPSVSSPNPICILIPSRTKARGCARAASFRVYFCILSHSLDPFAPCVSKFSSLPTFPIFAAPNPSILTKFCGERRFVFVPLS